MPRPIVSPGLDRRIRDAKQRGRLQAFDYLRRGADGTVEAVHCKVCGHRIAGLIIHHQPIETIRRDGTVIVRERLVWAKFADYAEVRIVFDDGSAHETPMCRRCADTLTIEQVDDSYLADLEALRAETGAERMDWIRLDRHPVRWERSE